MPGSFTVQIPVLPYLKPYITQMFGNPIPLNNKSFVGVFLLGVLEKENYHVSFKQEDKINRFQQFTETITCVGPYSIMRDIGWSLKKDHIIQFNRFFKEHFELDLHLYVKRNINTESRYAGYKKTIEDFAQQYNICIDETITFDALKKMEYRYRQEISVKMSSPQKQVTLFQ